MRIGAQLIYFQHLKGKEIMLKYKKNLVSKKKSCTFAASNFKKI